MFKPDPDQVVGSICECERGPRIKHRGGCAECELAEATRNHRERHTPVVAYEAPAVSRGEIRRFAERRFLDSAISWARD